MGVKTFLNKYKYELLLLAGQFYSVVLVGILISKFASHSNNDQK